MDAIWPLVVGFLLTSVLGGLLGTYDGLADKLADYDRSCTSGTTP